MFTVNLLHTVVALFYVLTSSGAFELGLSPNSWGQFTCKSGNYSQSCKDKRWAKPQSLALSCVLVTRLENPSLCLPAGRVISQRVPMDSLLVLWGLHDSGYAWGGSAETPAHYWLWSLREDPHSCILFGSSYASHACRQDPRQNLEANLSPGSSYD